MRINLFSIVLVLVVCARLVVVHAAAEWYDDGNEQRNVAIMAGPESTLNCIDVSPSKEGGGGTNFSNPICQQADPWITQHGGLYYACFSTGRGISIQVSSSLTVLGDKHEVWSAKVSNPPIGASQEVWAPELHYLNTTDRWYIYFAADDGSNANHRAWVLESNSSDPLGAYTLHGPLYTGDDPGLEKNNRWAIDMTILQRDSKLYAIWSGWADDADVQFLYIAIMKDPVTIASPRARICNNADYQWELVGETPAGRGLNEGPEILERQGRTFLAYSCSGSWQPTYKIGMLELQAGANPLNSNSWHKFSRPAFYSTHTTYGVGHCSFVQSPDGREDWIVYHAKLERTDGWKRAVYMQPFNWTSEGKPLLGRPVSAGQVLNVPSGQH